MENTDASQIGAAWLRGLSDAEYAAELAKIIRTKMPALPVIAGGKHVRNMTPEEYQAARRQIGAGNF